MAIVLTINQSIDRSIECTPTAQEIHEMTEMRAFAMGQYAHNNQPAHHLLFLFTLLHDPHTTQARVREVLLRGYGEDFYAGDEDNGEQGAWFVLAALGVFPHTPGEPSYVLSTPLFPHVRVCPSAAAGTTGDCLDIFAGGTDRAACFFDTVVWNGQSLTENVLEHSQFAAGGRLAFHVLPPTDDHTNTKHDEDHEQDEEEHYRWTEADLQRRHAMTTAQLEHHSVAAATTDPDSNRVHGNGVDGNDRTAADEAETKRLKATIVTLEGTSQTPSPLVGWLFVCLLSHDAW
jgi:hypothetical protein